MCSASGLGMPSCFVLMSAFSGAWVCGPAPLENSGSTLLGLNSSFLHQCISSKSSICPNKRWNTTRGLLCIKGDTPICLWQEFLNPISDERALQYELYRRPPRCSSLQHSCYQGSQFTWVDSRQLCKLSTLNLHAVPHAILGFLNREAQS